jgi:CRP/FNR family transcriptional regulator
MDLQEGCANCNLCSEGFFCHLPQAELEDFQRIKFTLAYPAGATLFLEGQDCRGIYILCKGRVKLSTSSRDGQVLIVNIAKPGEVLGLSATVSSVCHNTSAETGQPCQLNFVKAADFVHFLKGHPEARMHAAVHLSLQCQQAYRRFRSFVMSSAPERIARLILDWSSEDSVTATARGIKVSLTHDEIGQIVGMSRETVTRTLADFRKRHIAELQGSTLHIEDLTALQRLAAA